MAWTSKSEADNPWNAELDWDAENPSGVTISQPIFDDATDQVVCLVVGTGWDDGDFDRRVNLIAAAPELLEALSEARTELLLMRNNIMEEMRLSEGAAYRFEGVPDILQKRIDAIDAAIAKAGGAS